MPLKPEEVKAAIASGKNQKLADGRSLYLYVKNGRGYWTHQFQMDGVTRSKCGASARAHLGTSPQGARFVCRCAT